MKTNESREFRDELLKVKEIDVVSANDPELCVGRQSDILRCAM